MKNLIVILLLFALVFSFYTEGVAQVAVNTDGTAADPKAMLDVKSTDKGLLMPRMTTTQRTNISGLTSTQKGLLVYDTDLNAIWQFNGTAWAEIAPPATPLWTTKNATTIYTDKQQVGINNIDPQAALHVNGQVAVNTDGTTPSSKAALDVKSTTKGMHLPRMTTTQRDAMLPAPTDVGMLVFDTDKNRLYMFDGQIWLPFAVGSTHEPALTQRTASDANNVENNGYFGTSVAISGDYAIIGSADAAYIFYRSGHDWIQQAKLIPSELAMSFGMSVAISGDYAIVGAPQQHVPSASEGAAYIFYRSPDNTWTQQQKIVADFPPPANFDYFGASVAISGDYAIVANYPHDIPSSGSTREYAYIFKRTGTTWAMQTYLSEGSSPYAFGTSVAISGDYALVGVPAKFNGRVRVCQRVGASWGWTEIVAPDGAAGDAFGQSVSISGDYAVVGAYGDDANGYTNNGSAYIFFRSSGNTWDFQAKIIASDGADYTSFGTKVSISGDYIMVGNNKGTAYIFKRNGTNWVEIKKTKIRSTLNSSQATSGLNFPLSISPNFFLIGEENSNHPTTGRTTGVFNFGIIDF